MTKTEMAKVIVQALYNSPSLPKADNVNVKRTANQKKSVVEEQYKLACEVLKRNESPSVKHYPKTF